MIFRDDQMRGSNNSSPNKRENDYKNILYQKDMIIEELKSTLEVLEMKVKNSEDENKKLSERIEIAANNYNFKESSDKKK
jgi:hypothetical protein